MPRKVLQTQALNKIHTKKGWPIKAEVHCSVFIPDKAWTAFYDPCIFPHCCISVLVFLYSFIYISTFTWEQDQRPSTLCQAGPSTDDTESLNALEESVPTYSGSCRLGRRADFTKWYFTSHCLYYSKVVLLSPWPLEIWIKLTQPCSPKSTTGRSPWVQRVSTFSWGPPPMLVPHYVLYHEDHTTEHLSPFWVPRKRKYEQKSLYGWFWSRNGVSWHSKARNFMWKSSLTMPLPQPHPAPWLCASPAGTRTWSSLSTWLHALSPSSLHFFSSCVSSPFILKAKCEFLSYPVQASFTLYFEVLWPRHTQALGVPKHF